MTVQMSRGRYIFLSLVALCTADAAAAANNPSATAPTQTYRWVDDKGVVHYGDSVPSEYSQQERSVLNGQGVEIGHVAGHKSGAALVAAVAGRGTRSPARPARPHSALDLCFGKGYRGLAR